MTNFDIRSRAGASRLTRSWLARSAIAVIAALLLFGCAKQAKGPDLPKEPDFLTECEGDVFHVDLLNAATQLPDDALDVQKQQVVDFVFYATLGRLAGKSSIADVFSGVADEPLIRDEALSNVLRQQTGATRTVTTKSGDIVTLVEASNPETLRARVLDAIDEEALSLGHTPAHAIVYGFQLKPAEARAKVCRLKGLDRAALESSATNFRSATIESEASLAQFLAGGVDLLSAECTDKGVNVTGRSRPRTAAAPVTVEHVAALAQPLGVRFMPVSWFGKSVEDADPSLQEFAGETELLAAAPAAARPSDLPEALSTVLEWKRANPKIATLEIVFSYWLQRKFDGKPGFSLDPAYSKDEAIRALDEVLARMPKPGALEKMLAEWEGTWALTVLKARGSNAARAEASVLLSKVRHDLELGDDKSSDAILWRGQNSDSDAERLARALRLSVASHSSRQCARYDGPLAGTVAGMSFFYTDFGLKLASTNWAGSGPENEVEGFESIVNRTGSTSRCSEDTQDLINTRFWIGLSESGYAKTAESRVRFAPLTTRVFAKSSAVGYEDEETDATPDNRRFVRQFSSKYLRISEWEPQYEVVNQLMKWSAAVQLCATAHRPKAFEFLAKTAVERNLNLANWTTQTPSLRYTPAVQRAERGVRAKGTTECLPRLLSPLFTSCGIIQSIEGGVSAASARELGAKSIQKADTPPGLGRLSLVAEGVDASASLFKARSARTGGTDALTDIEVRSEPQKITFGADMPEVVDSSGVSRKATQAGDSGFISRLSPVFHTEKVVSGSARELEVLQRENSLRGTGLHASDLDQANVVLKLDPGDALRAKTLARSLITKMNRDGLSLHDAAMALAPSHDVNLLDNGSVAVQLGTNVDDGYVIMTSGSGSRGPPRNSLGFTVGSDDGGPGDRTSWGRQPSVNAWIVPRPEAATYFASIGAKPLERGDAVAEAVQTRLAANDLVGAQKLIDAAPSVLGAARILSSALERKDLAAAERAILGVGKLPEYADLGALRDLIFKHRVRLERNGGDPSSLAQLSVNLAIAQRRLATVGQSEAAQIAELSGRVVAPVRYSGTQIPKTIYERNEPLPSGDQYVSRLIDIPLEDAHPMKFVSFNNEPYEFRESTESTGSRSSSRVGPATRLFETQVRAVAILRCSDSDAGFPPCHKSAAVTFGQALGDSCTVEGLRVCAIALGACDAGGDELFSQRAELACVEGVRKRFAASASEE